MVLINFNNGKIISLWLYPPYLSCILVASGKFINENTFRKYIYFCFQSKTPPKIIKIFQKNFLFGNYIKFDT